STTQWKFLVEEGLDKALREHAARGGAIFGTCAGAILLAREVRKPAQPSLGLADITVIRNAYGRQLASEVRHEITALSPAPIEMVFIRAPIIERMGPNVETLASSEGQAVLVRQERMLISTFHPELTTDTTTHTCTQHNLTQHNTTQHNTTQHNTTQHNTTQHNTTQHNTTQHNTTQHNTT